MGFQPQQQAPGVRAINTVGRTLRGIGLRWPQLQAEDLCQRAMVATGFEDFGGNDFQEPLAQLLDALEHEAGLSLIGRLSARSYIVSNLKLRLQLIESKRNNPETFQRPIRRPLFIMGLPRTGTSMLHELLALDPGLRAPLTWEVEQPFPPARPETLYTDPRIAACDKSLDQLGQLATGFRAIHSMGATLPQECVALMSPSLLSETYGTTYRIPSYRRYLLAADHVPAYRWHHLFLQHLQSHFEEVQWVLKTPVHLTALDALLARYPDALFVQTHRDPAEVIGSVSSLACTLRRGFSDDLQPERTALEECEHFAAVLEKGVSQRRGMPDEAARCFDMHLRQLIEQPIATIEALYGHFGMHLSGEAADAMRAYIAQRPNEKHGSHRYRLEDFGLNREAVRRRFATYCQHFDV